MIFSSGKAANDVKIEQCDLDRANQYSHLLKVYMTADGTPMTEILAAAFARHRQAAEKLQQERDAAIVDAYAEKTDADLLRWCDDDEAVAVITGRGIAATEIATAIRSQNDD